MPRDLPTLNAFCKSVSECDITFDDRLAKLQAAQSSFNCFARVAMVDTVTVFVSCFVCFQLVWNISTESFVSTAKARCRPRPR
jgi:hypothetical protein